MRPPARLHPPAAASAARSGCALTHRTRSLPRNSSNRSPFSTAARFSTPPLLRSASAKAVIESCGSSCNRRRAAAVGGGGGAAAVRSNRGGCCCWPTLGSGRTPLLPTSARGLRLRWEGGKPKRRRCCWSGAARAAPGACVALQGQQAAAAALRSACRCTPRLTAHLRHGAQVAVETAGMPMLRRSVPPRGGAAGRAGAAAVAGRALAFDVRATPSDVTDGVLQQESAQRFQRPCGRLGTDHGGIERGGRWRKASCAVQSGRLPSALNLFFPCGLHRCLRPCRPSSARTWRLPGPPPSPPRSCGDRWRREAGGVSRAKQGRRACVSLRALLNSLLLRWPELLAPPACVRPLRAFRASHTCRTAAGPAWGSPPCHQWSSCSDRGCQ